MPLPLIGSGADSVQLRPRDLVRLRAAVTRTDSSPWPLEVRTGQYHRTHVQRGIVQYRRANAVLPPFVVGSQPVTGLQPRCARDYRGRVRLFYTAEPLPVGGVLQLVSDDDGVSFSGPASVMPGAAFPSIAYDARTETVFATMYGGGALYGWRETAAIAGTPFLLRDQNGAPLAVEEDVAHATPAPGAEARWLLAARILGEGALSLWESTDDGATWLRRASGLLAGYKHPHILADPSTGMLLVAGYASERLAGVLRYPGEASWRSLHLFAAAGGVPLEVVDTTFGIAAAFEPSSRWVLPIRIKAETAISEWWSADYSRSWSRVDQ